MFDLGLLYDQKNPDSVLDTLNAAVQLGYDCVAFNQTVPGKLSPQHANKFPRSDTSKINYLSQLRLEGERQTFRQLSRITVCIDDPSQIHSLNSDPVLRSYDILALRPSTEDLLQRCCKDCQFEIVSLDLSQKQTFLLKPPMVSLAIQRGIMFEISYSPALQDINLRRYLIKNATGLVRATRGRNIIITSQALGAMDIRGPYDVANLASLFGLETAAAKESLSKNCREVLVLAETRKSIKSAFTIEPLPVLDSVQQWKLSAVPEQEQTASESRKNTKKRKREKA